MNAQFQSAVMGRRHLSDLAIAKLHSSAIAKDIALTAGILSVEDAKAEVHDEFASVPALVFQYYDIAGNLVFFERDGELLQFVRVRYLADPPAKSFIKRVSQRYAQLRGSGVHAYFPQVPGIDWRATAADPSVALAIVEGELKALKLCAEGLPAIGIGGVDCFLRKPEQD